MNKQLTISLLGLISVIAEANHQEQIQIIGDKAIIPTSLLKIQSDNKDFLEFRNHILDYDIL